MMRYFTSTRVTRGTQQEPKAAEEKRDPDHGHGTAGVHGVARVAIGAFDQELLARGGGLWILACLAKDMRGPGNQGGTTCNHQAPEDVTREVGQHHGIRQRDRPEDVQAHSDRKGRGAKAVVAKALASGPVRWEAVSSRRQAYPFCPGGCRRRRSRWRPSVAATRHGDYCGSEPSSANDSLCDTSSSKPRPSTNAPRQSSGPRRLDRSTCPSPRSADSWGTS